MTPALAGDKAGGLDMRASQQMRKGVRTRAVVTGLLAVAGGYLGIGAIPQAPAPASVKDTVPSWAAERPGSEASSGAQRDEDLYPERFP
jgi:hypothetical protein